MARLPCVFWMLFAIGSAAAQEQPQTITVGPAHLTVGASKDTVISQLSPGFTLKDHGSTLDVLTRGIPPIRHVAHISFKSDRLAEVIKDWSPDDQQKGVETVEALYGLIANFVQEGNQNCTLALGEAHEPDFEGKSAFIVCGRKYVKVTLIHSTQWVDSVIVDEVLSGDSK
ncbi:MAG: hypothetical protein WBV69_15940 [Candidatus Sulfotelmatobacter sp.]